MSLLVERGTRRLGTARALRWSKAFGMPRGPRAITKAAGLCTAVGLLLAACGPSGAGSSSSGSGPALRGGAAYFAELPLQPPTYIFPLVSGAYYTTENTSYFQTLMYEPLYWFGDKDRASVDYRLSIGNPPVYSDHDRVVTVTLKHYLWSNGQPVTSRDVLFWINLLKADKSAWASYVPGGFPDNVTSAAAVDPTTVRLRLNASYNPTWYTYNELSQITPLPLAWDRTSLSEPAPPAGATGLPDSTPNGARAVYDFLNAQAKSLSTYATSSIWSVVDGPWKLTSSRRTARPPSYPTRGSRDRTVHVWPVSSSSPSRAPRQSSLSCGPGHPPVGRARRASRSRSVTCPTTTCRSTRRSARRATG